MPVVTIATPVMLGSQSLVTGVSVNVSEEQAAQWAAEGHIVADAAAEAAAAEAAAAEAAAAEAAASASAQSPKRAKA
jgi:hypothetical protein